MHCSNQYTECTIYPKSRTPHSLGLRISTVLDLVIHNDNYMHVVYSVYPPHKTIKTPPQTCLASYITKGCHNNTYIHLTLDNPTFLL